MCLSRTALSPLCTVAPNERISVRNPFPSGSDRGQRQSAEVGIDHTRLPASARFTAKSFTNSAQSEALFLAASPYPRRFHSGPSSPLLTSLGAKEHVMLFSSERSPKHFFTERSPVRIWKACILVHALWLRTKSEAFRHRTKSGANLESVSKALSL